MIQLQFRIEHDEESLNTRFLCEILEREDANDGERILAKEIEKMLKNWCLYLAQFPGVKLNKMMDIGN